MDGGVNKELSTQEPMSALTKGGKTHNSRKQDAEADGKDQSPADDELPPLVVHTPAEDERSMSSTEDKEKDEVDGKNKEE